MINRLSKCWPNAFLVFGLFFFACCSNPQPQGPAPSSGPTPATSPSKPLPLYLGVLDDASCDRVAGWALDKNNPDTPLTLEIFDGDTPVGTTIANLSRPDLASLGLGNGRNAYSFVVPSSLKDGKPHSIRVRISGTNVDLLNTPKSIVCPSK